MSYDHQNAPVIALSGGIQESLWIDPGYEANDAHFDIELLPYKDSGEDQQWPFWQFGYVVWIGEPQAGMPVFRRQMSELRHATMLEF